MGRHVLGKARACLADRGVVHGILDGVVAALYALGLDLKLAARRALAELAQLVYRGTAATEDVHPVQILAGLSFLLLAALPEVTEPRLRDLVRRREVRSQLIRKPVAGQLVHGIAVRDLALHRTVCGSIQKGHINALQTDPDVSGQCTCSSSTHGGSSTVQRHSGCGISAS